MKPLIYWSKHRKEWACIGRIYGDMCIAFGYTPSVAYINWSNKYGT